jgi:hypothetical protein
MLTTGISCSEEAIQVLLDIEINIELLDKKRRKSGY